MARIVADVAMLLGAENFADSEGLSRADAGVGSGAHVRPDDPDDILRRLSGAEDSIAEPDDPAVLRLLPSASRDEADVADEFRRLTEGDLRDLKISRLRAMWAQLREVGPQWPIPVAEAMSTAAALTDLRLVLGARLRLDSDEAADRLHEEIDLATHALATDDDNTLGVDPERVWLGMLYQALSWLQESIVQCAIEAAGVAHDEEDQDE